MSSFKKIKQLAKGRKKANHGRKPGKGKPRSQFKRSALGI
ncbi:MAG: hypothetical protein AMXMBFR7_08990 [Planctomycetota bacterium]